MKLMRTLSALPLLALPLTAQVVVEANVSAVIATQNMSKMLSGDNLTGGSFGIGLRIPITEDFGHRVHLSAMSIKGATGSGLESKSPQHLTLGWDVTQKLGKNWTVFGGLMAVKWKQDESKITDPNFGDIARPAGNAQQFPTTANANNSGKGTKLGARIGVERVITKSLSCNFSFQQSEFNKIFTPSWLNVGLTYRFGK